ncbi:FAD-binding oxidoreductase [Saccharomonospora saliphila]|uniref:FAD-binding oxidoreductase n=1 Tax=Saccharomonospora saliphila TaxID=369829 RepID=UPI0003688A21|nr:FAD-binding oxidoreductase [Saccharomonospora saliphila]
MSESQPSTRITADDLRYLGRTLRGSLLPARTGADAGFNRIVTGRPSAVVRAVNRTDVQTSVRWAADRGLPIAVRATGHGNAVPADGALLVETSAINGVRVDPRTRTAHVEAGVPWATVVRQAARHGLAPLNGAAPTVGVVGYTLGGGHGPLGRSYGYAADRVRDLELVTADGVARAASPDQAPELFWAVRGGKGNFGVVTAMTIDLFPVPGLYGGGLFFSGDDAARLLRAWRDWTEHVPDAMQSSVALMRSSDDARLPRPARGRFLVHVRIAFNGPADEGRRWTRPLRGRTTPLADTVTEMPYSDVARIHNDPTRPGRYSERSARLSRLDDTAVDTIVSFAATGDVPAIEVRHLGGALARPPEHANAVPFRDTAYTVFSGIRVEPREAGDTDDRQRRLVEALEPWRHGGPFLSFISSREASAGQVRAAYDTDTYGELVRVKRHYDPDNLFRINHNIPPEAATS